jgi:glycosyltransferase involved in cell wall biosynthesis
VIDGPQFAERARAVTDSYSKVSVIQLPENTGGDGFYGHRIYAATGFLINTDYVLYLDQDNWMDPDHVATAVNTIEAGRLDWCYSLRKIHDPSGAYLLDDDCESLGRWPTWVDLQSFLVDTSCYCIKREVIARMSGAWYGKWGADRIFLATLAKNFPLWGCTGRATLNYRLGGNPGSVTKDFFVRGNAVMRSRYPSGFPWR